MGDTLATPSKIWSLCETQTLTWNFPSSAAAERMPALLLLSVLLRPSFLLCPTRPRFLFVVIFSSDATLPFRHFLSLMTASSFPLIFPKQPQPLVYLLRPADPYSPCPIRGRAKLSRHQMVCSFSSTGEVVYTSTKRTTGACFSFSSSNCFN